MHTSRESEGLSKVILIETPLIQKYHALACDLSFLLMFFWKGQWLVAQLAEYVPQVTIIEVSHADA